MGDEDKGFYDEDGRWWPEGAELCDRCQGLGIAECYCGGDQCYCDNYGEMECPQCDGEGRFVPTAAFKAAREQNAKWWREVWKSSQPKPAIPSRRGYRENGRD